MLAPFKLPEAEQSLAELVAMSPEMREQWLSGFNTPDALERLKFRWDFWGRPSQFSP